MKTTKTKKSKAAVAAVVPVVRANDIALETERTIDISTAVVPVVPVAAVVRQRKARSNVTMIATPDETQRDNDWQFPVAQRQLTNPFDGSLLPLHGVFRTDTNTYLGEYKGQKMLPYTELVSAFDTALTSGGIEFQRSILTTNNGARMFATYSLDVRKGNDAFTRKVMLHSSYNGTLANEYQFMAEMLRCLNGMIGMATVQAVCQKHSTRFDMGRMTHNVVQAIENGTEETERMIERMGNIAITDAQARNILSNIVAKGNNAGVSPKAGYLTYHNWRNPQANVDPSGDTLWRLYNGATRMLRDVAHVGRFELSRRGNLYLTGAFHLAAERKNDLATLLATPATPLDFDNVTVN